jgi:hypothetical protein
MRDHTNTLLLCHLSAALSRELMISSLVLMDHDNVQYATQYIRMWRRMCVVQCVSKSYFVCPVCDGLAVTVSRSRFLP